MYYLFVENEKINGAGQCPIVNEEIENIEVAEDIYNKYVETPNYYIYQDGKIVENPNYIEDCYKERKHKFESQFLQTSLGNYRLEPKGYANAQQSIDTINNIVNAFGGLNQQVASMVIFYPTPDFTKEEECTEEWLVAHQYNPESMSKEEWVKYYIEFTTAYAQKQYMLGL